MTPRQRRGVLLLGLALVGAVLVFVMVAAYVAGVREEVEPKTQMLVLSRPVSAYEPVEAAMVRRREVPRKWLPDRALRDPTQVAGLVAGTDLPAGVALQQGMLVPPPDIGPGEREIAILISADTGVAGKIRPGDIVDIHATFAGDRQSVPRARTVIAGARIVTIGTPREGSERRAFGPVEEGLAAGGAGADRVVPVTFALSPPQVRQLTYAESFAEEVRLALVRRGETSEVPGDKREYYLPPTRRRAPE